MLAPEVLTLLFSILTQLLVMTAAVFSFTVFVAVCSGSTHGYLGLHRADFRHLARADFVGTAVINNTIPGIYLNYSPYLVGALSPLAAAYVQSSFYTFQWLFSLWWVALTAAPSAGRRGHVPPPQKRERGKLRLLSAPPRWLSASFPARQAGSASAICCSS